MDGKVREVIYYSAGFFGYGQKGDFRQWSLAHFLPVLIAIAAILLIWRNREKIRNWKHEKTFRFFYPKFPNLNYGSII